MAGNLVTIPGGRPTRSLKSWRSALGGNEFRVALLNDAMPYDSVLDNPAQTYDYLSPRMAESIVTRPEFENFAAIYLNTRNKPIGWEVITNGTVDTILVAPPMVFRSAILSNASAIILAHNHPSGDPSPSDADIRTTRDLMRGAKLLKIEILDHIILGKPSPTRPKAYASLRELGHMHL